MDTFNKLFENKAIKIKENDAYIVNLSRFENGEIIYLINNCFFHVCEKRLIKERIEKLKRDLKWNVFNYICIFPERVE